MLKINELKNFGIIKESKCEIELNNLTIFMGDNSSGKSYLAMLNAGFLVFQKSFYYADYYKLNIDNQIYKEIEYINQNIDTIDKYEIDITNNHEFKDFVSDIVLKSMNERIFNNELDLTNTILKIDIANKITFIKSEIFYIDSKKCIIEYNSQIRLIYLIELLLVNAHIKNLNNENIFGFYLPASRTGFLQTYKILNQYARDSAFGNQSNQKVRLNKLTIDFLSLLDNVSDKEDNHIANYIEQNVLKGKIRLEPISGEIRFFANNGKEVQKHLLSSTVSEMIPLVAFLKSGYIRQHTLLIIEEPEAHLSFDNQRMMAKVIAMLIKDGVKVLITTHSDFLVYELNNLMKKEYIKNHSTKENILNLINNSDVDETQKEEYNKEVQSLYDDISLDSKQVSIYNFLIDPLDGMSVIDRVEVDKYGIESDYIFESTKKVVNERSTLYDLMDMIDNA